MLQGKETRKNLSGLDTRPRVVWDMTFAEKSLTGTRVYARNLFDALQALNAYQLSETRAAETMRAERTGSFLTGAQNVWWQQAVLPNQLHMQKTALLHASAYLGSLRAPCPMIVNVLDTIYLEFPRDFDWKWRLYARWLIPPTINHAAALITLSEHARGKIAQAYHFPRERIHVIYPGVGSEFFLPMDAGTIHAVRARLALRHDYLLFVGAQEPRKNIPALLRAFARVRPQFPELEFALVGPRGNGSVELQGVVRGCGLQNCVRELGFVKQRDLPALYAGARALVFASKLEGFGMPSLEAMACGAPVIAAPNPPLPEGLGDAAYFTADDSPDALAQGIARVLSDRALAQELRRRGGERAREFSWERSARAAAKLYSQVLNERNP